MKLTVPIGLFLVLLNSIRQATITAMKMLPIASSYGIWSVRSFPKMPEFVPFIKGEINFAQEWKLVGQMFR